MCEMCKRLTALMPERRRRCTVRSGPRSRGSTGVDAPEGSCCTGYRLGAAERERIGAVVKASGRELTSATSVLHMPPRVDADGRAIRLAERHDGAPCRYEDCPDEWFFAMPMLDRMTAERAAARGSRPAALRYFAKVRLASALVLDATEFAVSEASLRANDPHAAAIASAMREAGADMLVVRGIHAPRVAVVFRHAIGDRIRVLDEAEMTLGADGRWQRQVREPAPAERGAWRASLGGVRWPRRLLRMRSLASELVLALACFMLAPVVTDALGSSVTVPLWLGAGAIAGTVLATLGLAGRFAPSSPPSRPDELTRIVQQIEHQTTREISDYVDLVLRDDPQWDPPFFSDLFGENERDEDEDGDETRV